MLHNTRDQDIGSVTDSIYLNFLAHNVLIYQDWMLLGDLIDDTDKFINIFIADSDLHSLSSQYIGRAY